MHRTVRNRQTKRGTTMSALGHERTFAPQKVMSALPPKADMCGATAHVCYGPEADMSITLGLSSSASFGVL